ncbi:MAG: hypothetical protein ABEJ30_06730 [Halorientalis sp.]
MGLRSLLDDLLGAESGSEATEEGGELELRVDVERRAGAIMEHYGLSGEDARQVAEILATELGREEGYARTMVADRVARELDVSEERARTIVDSEVASVRNLARARQFREQEGHDVRVRWVDSMGTDDSPVCADVRAAIDERGAVTLEELREIIREAAADHPEGTPERADDLLPHEGCRHTVVRHFEE